MNDEAEAALLAAGVPEERIHIERFGVAPQAGASGSAQGGAVEHEARPGDAERARITIVRDGMRREFDFEQGRRQHPRRGRHRRPGGAVLLHVGRVRHLPRAAGRRPGAHGRATSRWTRPTWRRASCSPASRIR
jgi:hypothetical protein